MATTVVALISSFRPLALVLSPIAVNTPAVYSRHSGFESGPEKITLTIYFVIVYSTRLILVRFSILRQTITAPFCVLHDSAFIITLSFYGITLAYTICGCLK